MSRDQKLPCSELVDCGARGQVEYVSSLGLATLVSLAKCHRELVTSDKTIIMVGFVKA